MLITIESFVSNEDIYKMRQNITVYVFQLMNLDILTFKNTRGEYFIGYMGLCRWKGHGFQANYSGTGSSNHRKLV